MVAPLVHQREEVCCQPQATLGILQQSPSKNLDDHQANLASQHQPLEAGFLALISKLVRS
jgi:hypothetical protein